MNHNNSKVSEYSNSMWDGLNFEILVPVWSDFNSAEIHLFILLHSFAIIHRKKIIAIFTTWAVTLAKFIIKIINVRWRSCTFTWHFFSFLGLNSKQLIRLRIFRDIIISTLYLLSNFRRCGIDSSWLSCLIKVMLKNEYQERTDLSEKNFRLAVCKKMCCDLV